MFQKKARILGEISHGFYDDDYDDEKDDDGDDDSDGDDNDLEI